MEQFKEVLEELSLTSHNEEIPYILTPEEEQRHIERKIDSLKDHYKWLKKSDWIAFVSVEHREMKNAALEMEVNKIDWENKFDRHEYLSKMNALKFWDMKDVERRDAKMKAERDALMELELRCNYDYMLKLLSYNSQGLGKPLIVSPGNENYIKAVCYFLSKDPRFEKELGFSFRRGLLIRGNYGVGKTHIIRCVSNNELQPIQMKSMLDITQRLNETGEAEVNIYSRKKLYLDDVGTEEPTVNHYGTKINWFKNFIETQYTHESVYPRLIITTNCSFDEIEQKYGGRVRSRMAEMFNIINVSGEDLRKI